MAFSGPLAVGALMAINSKRLGRLRRDAWIYAAITVATVLLTFAIVNFPDFFTVEYSSGRPRSVARFAIRGAGVLTFALVYCYFRPHYRAMTLSGLDSPSPWKIGTLVFVLGMVVQMALAILFFELRRNVGVDPA